MNDTKRAAFTARDIRFTAKGTTLYAILMAWPEGEAAVASLAKGSALYPGEIKGVTLLGSTEKIAWTRDAAGLKAKLPAKKPCDFAYVLKIAS